MANMIAKKIVNGGEYALGVNRVVNNLDKSPFRPSALLGTLARTDKLTEVAVERLRAEASTFPSRSLYQELSEASCIYLLCWL